MKKLLRYYFINLLSLWATTQFVPGLTYSGGVNTLFLGAGAFAIINILLVPLLKILLLPLNLLTLGFFSWITNVLALYALTTAVSGFYLVPYRFNGIIGQGFSIPPFDLNTFWVAVLASVTIGVITHFLQWLVK